MLHRRIPTLAFLLFVPLFSVTVPGADEPSVLDHPALDIALSSFAREEYARELGWFADDERRGREPGTRGSIEAGDWAAAEFLRLGLTPLGDEIDGKHSFFQSFERGGKRGLLPGHCFSVADRKFTVGEDWSLLGGCDSFALDGVEVVFAGYGITAPEYEYDDYEGIDAEGKAVLILRFEPQEKKKDSAWNGSSNTKYSYFQNKLSNARDHGAVAVLFVNGPLHHDPDRDPLSGLTTRVGRNGTIPMVQVRGNVAECLLSHKALGLREMQAKIDKGARPASTSLGGVTIDLVGTVGTLAKARNVIGLLEGADRRLKDEVVVIGAHYDHLGLGSYGARDPKRKGEIHNGADDNGSGSVGVVELAEAFIESGIRPRRSILFMLFDAEEKGLIGSKHYVQNPLLPLENTIGMINLDMIARAAGKKCSVLGASTAKEWTEILEAAEKDSPLNWKNSTGSGGGGSDHASFMGKKIPVLFFFTGIHKDYHTPDDDIDKCNIDGAVEILGVVFKTVLLLADRVERPVFVEPPSGRRGGRARVTLGVWGEARGDGKGGFVISRLASGSGAEKAGLCKEDVLLKIGDSSITGLGDLLKAIRKHKAGDMVMVRYLRGDEESEVQVVLGG